MRRFIFLSHTAPSTGEWSLEDLPSTGGRVDVLCRNIQSAFHVSHGIRRDVEVYCVFTTPKARIVRMDGATIRRLNPDERSTAARLQQALAQTGAGPSWKMVQDGLYVADLELEDLLEEMAGEVMLLDPDGTALSDITWPSEPTLVLSDHVPFTEAEYAVLNGRGVNRVSLGATWYHGNHVAAVVQYHLDLALGAPNLR